MKMTENKTNIFITINDFFNLIIEQHFDDVEQEFLELNFQSDYKNLLEINEEKYTFILAVRQYINTVINLAKPEHIYDCFPIQINIPKQHDMNWVKNTYPLIYKNYLLYEKLFKQISYWKIKQLC